MNNKILLFILGLYIIIGIGCSESLSLDYQEDGIVEDSIDSLFRFIHISDTHGSTVTIDAVNDYCSIHKCDFIILTGDVVPNKKIVESIKSSNTDYLIVPGNHDAYENEGPGQFGFRSSFLDTINMPVSFPDKKINYWYRDYEKNGKTLRVIGLDQFEQNSFGNTPGLFAIMTQQQIDWFIHLLEKSSEADGIVILIHMGFGNSNKGQRDTSNHNEFISELASSYNNSYDFYGPEDPFMIPEIMEAYSSGNNLDKIYNKGTKYEKIVRTDFSKASDNFVGYFGGHLHWDEVEFLNSFPNQLQCLVAFCGNGKGSNWNDLIKTDYTYNFNVVDVDFTSNSLRIVRQGASRTISKQNRKEISFPFWGKKQGSI